MEGLHLCATMRGVKKANAVMITSSLKGSFRRDPRTRQEFMDHLKRGSPEVRL